MFSSVEMCLFTAPTFLHDAGRGTWKECFLVACAGVERGTWGAGTKILSNFEKIYLKRSDTTKAMQDYDSLN